MDLNNNDNNQDAQVDNQNVDNQDINNNVDAGAEGAVDNQNVDKSEPKGEEGTTNRDTKAEGLEGFLSEAGMDLEDVLMDMDSNEGLTPELLKQLQEKHGDAVANLLASQLDSVFKDVKETQQKEAQEAYEFIESLFPDEEQSGEESFKELQGWAKENIDQGTRDELNHMIQVGGLARKLALREIADTFKESGDYSQAPVLKEADTGNFDSGNGDLSSREYNQKLNELLASGEVYGDSPAIAQLDARRMKSKAKGIK